MKGRLWIQTAHTIRASLFAVACVVLGNLNESRRQRLTLNGWILQYVRLRQSHSAGPAAKP